jgi:Tfp pilus assembly protein PilF
LVINFTNLAALYEAQGKHAEAEEFYKRTLAITENFFDPDHPNIATSLENYAAFLRKRSREAEAEKLEARAKAIRAKQAQRSPTK